MYLTFLDFNIYLYDHLWVYVPFYTKRRCQKGISKMQLWNASVTSIFCGSWKFRLHLMISITFGLQFAWFALWACLMKQVFQKDFVWIKLLKFQSMSIETESILRTTVNTSAWSGLKFLGLGRAQTQKFRARALSGFSNLEISSSNRLGLLSNVKCGLFGLRKKSIFLKKI